MNISLNTFNASIDEIEAHIQTLEDSQKIVAETKSMKLPLSVTEPLKRVIARRNSEKSFEYRANIVSLYGAFERYIEDLIKEYVNEIKSICVSYQELDDRIRKGYIEKWKNLHSNFIKGHTKYVLTEETMVKNMHDTIIGGSSGIMAECYIPIGGNYRHKTICEIMTELGATNIQTNLINYEPLKSYIVNNGLAGVGESVLFHEIEKLIERRNEVAHGAKDDLLSDDEFMEMMRFVKVYVMALNSFMNDELLRVEWDVKHSLSTFKPLNVFKDGMVPAFTVNKLSIRKGDKYLVKRPNGNFPRFLKMSLKEIQKEEVNGASSNVDEVVATSDTVISIETEEMVTTGCEFKFSI